MTNRRYWWAAPGDVNAFFGLMLDNVADLLLTVGLLVQIYQFPANFALRYMVPGTAIGVLVGDLLFFWMALALARRTGRQDVTAMPLGLDTPSTFGMVFFVLGPSFLHARGELGLSELEAARYTWHIGICAIVVSGLFKFACALGSNLVRRLAPRAGLLGSLTAVALVLISFLPLLEILHYPVAGLSALAVILTTLVARVPFPWRIPGALAGLLVGAFLYFGMQSLGLLHHVSEAEPFSPADALFPSEWLSVFRWDWVSALGDSLQYLPVVIPFALGTVVGGIDCTESAAAAGDEYDTGAVIGVEALATVAAALCGGVIQTTPYIGHPAYKAMGGRAAFTLATALFVGGAGLIGYFGYLYAIIPKASVFPILIFIGLEITSQSFQATTRRHFPAVALACVPALAYLGLTFADRLFGDAAIRSAGLAPERLADPILRADLLTLRVLGNGFIVTSLLWASALTSMIDRRLWLAGCYLAVAGLFALFGVIHSPLAGGPMFLPWKLPAEVAEIPLRYGAGYLVSAAILLAWDAWYRRAAPPLDEEPES